MQFKDFLQNNTPQKKQQAKAKQKNESRAIAIITAGIGAAISLLTMQVVSVSFGLTLAALMGLGGWLFFQNIKQEKTHHLFVRHLNQIIKNHDRLVREVARNRNDIVDIKEGLTDTAKTFDEPVNAHNKEDKAHRVQEILRKLGTVGQKPRPNADSAAAGKDILTLRSKRMAAPPKPDKQGEPDRGDEYSNAVILELIHHAIENDRFGIFVQPIVRLPQRKPAFYEIYGRLTARTGTYLSAARYMNLARQESSIPAIDNLLLIQILQILRDTGNDNAEAPPYFLNVTAQTLQDPNYMGDLLTFLERSHKLARRLVFEIPQRDLARLDTRAKAVIDGLSKLGCRLSIDTVEDHDINMRKLKEYHVSFIKLDSRRIMDEGSNRNGISRMREIKRDLEDANIEIIVEKIENERDLREILDYSVNFGQGFLFGAPELYGRFVRDKIWHAA